MCRLCDCYAVALRLPEDHARRAAGSQPAVRHHDTGLG